MPRPKKSLPTRSRNGQTKRSASGVITAKKKKSPPRSKQLTALGGPTPLVKIVSTNPATPVTVPCSNFTVTAACRLSSPSQICAARMLDCSSSPSDVQPTSGPGTDPNNPQFVFNLTVPSKTYALEVFILNTSTSTVILSDGAMISTH